MRIICLGLCCIALAGCSFGEQPADVRGTVLMDGQPLDEGEIIFEAKDNNKTPVGGPIRNGQYAVKVLPGPKLVRIKASRSVSIPDPVLGAAAKEPRIGPEFNDQTKLEAEIQPGEQEVNFEVKELPRPKAKS